MSVGKVTVSIESDVLKQLDRLVRERIFFEPQSGRAYSRERKDRAVKQIPAYTGV